MKKTLFALSVGVLIFGSFSSADYVRIKTAEGTYGYSTRPAYLPYVCYDRRVEYFRNGTRYLRYEGCTRSARSCRSIGMAHFGRYPNNSASYRALRRCVNSSPRFVD